MLLKKSKNVAHVIKIPRVIGFHILNTSTNGRASLETNPVKFARTHA